MVDTWATNCCWCFSLPFGSFLICCFILGSNILALAHYIDLSDDDPGDISHERRVHLEYTIFGSAAISVGQLLIGTTMLFGLFMDKYKIVKWASVAFLVCTVLRILASVVRVVEGRNYDSFLVIIIVSVFYFYCFVVLWSYCQEEEEVERARKLSPSQVKLVKRLTTRDWAEPGPSHSQQP